MLPPNVEILENMNSMYGPYCKWYVRIIDAKIIPYQFKSRDETEIVYAERFECVLVSRDPAQYMLATVPFNVKDRLSAKRALEDFKNNDVLEISTPAFDGRKRQEFNGCPVKTVLLLVRPTTVKHVPITNIEMLQYPAQGLQVSLPMMALLQQVRNSGSANCTKTFDFSGKFLGLSEKSHG